ncbi:MAG: acetate--CoA ligase family protein [Nitrospinota bacterium]|nr:acetate--CoA ligase family protein [Nitrospinota bacterium]
MLDDLLAPKSVAVIGASRQPGKVGHELLANLINGGYKGAIIPVNPKASQLLGLNCYPNLASHRNSVDLAAIAVPTANALAAVREALDANVKSIVILTAGFRESGQEGARLEEEITRLLKSSGTPLLGPNCLGVINTSINMNLSFARSAPLPGPISLFSQSGALLAAILDWAWLNRLGFSKLISLGNKAHLTEVDFLRALATDEETKVICGYLESITEGDLFIKAAEQAAEKKPVIIQKVGTTSAGKLAASSHTGSLAGADMAYGSAFGRAGVIRAESFEELLDFSMAFSMQPCPKGTRVAIITNAGGPGVMAADAVERDGLIPASLEAGSIASLRSFLPPAAGLGNPIDILGDADPQKYRSTLEIVINDNQVDAAIVILTPQAMTSAMETASLLAQADRAGKPVIAVFMGGKEVKPCYPELLRQGTPVFASPERAVRAIKAMAKYEAWRRRPVRIVTHYPVNRRRAERVFARIARQGRAQAGEAASKEILRAYGFSIPEGALALSAGEAVEIASRAGFPVAMKIASPSVIHKTDMGGVRLGILDADGVRDGFDLLNAKFQRLFPGAPLDGIYVESMARRGREVIIGMARDPQFGPMLMFGLGGIFVEALKDVAFHLAPITADEAMAMLKSTRSYQMMTGARGGVPMNLSAVAEGLQRISQLVTDFPTIMELDINPLIVPEGSGPGQVADARITIGKELKT